MFVAVVLVVCGVAAADVDVRIDTPPAAQIFDTTLVDHQPSPQPHNVVTHPAGFDRTSRPRVRFTDTYSLTAFGRSPATNYHQLPEAHIPQTVRQLPGRRHAVSLRRGMPRRSEDRQVRPGTPFDARMVPHRRPDTDRPRVSPRSGCTGPAGPPPRSIPERWLGIFLASATTARARRDTVFPHRG